MDQKLFPNISRVEEPGAAESGSLRLVGARPEPVPIAVQPDEDPRHHQGRHGRQDVEARYKSGPNKRVGEHYRRLSKL